MEELQQLDELEREIRGVRDPGRPRERRSRSASSSCWATEAAEDLRAAAGDDQAAGGRRLPASAKGDELSLTARAIRKIADKALRDIFAQLKRDRIGGHAIERRGRGRRPTDDTKAYEFGDPFLLDLKETVMNAVERTGPGHAGAPGPERLRGLPHRAPHAGGHRPHARHEPLDDLRGCFLPAKKVALALNSPDPRPVPARQRSTSSASRSTRASSPPSSCRTLSWSEWNIGTNMHAGFVLARQLLARHKGGNKQIIMITDGEPTAHLEGGVADFNYPPT